MFMVKKKRDTKNTTDIWLHLYFQVQRHTSKKKGDTEKEWLVSDPNKMKETVTIQKQFDIFNVFPSELMCK